MSIADFPIIVLSMTLFFHSTCKTHPPRQLLSMQWNPKCCCSRVELQVNNLHVSCNLIRSESSNINSCSGFRKTAHDEAFERWMHDVDERRGYNDARRRQRRRQQFDQREWDEWYENHYQEQQHQHPFWEQVFYVITWRMKLRFLACICLKIVLWCISSFTVPDIFYWLIKLYCWQRSPGS